VCPVYLEGNPGEHKLNKVRDIIQINGGAGLQALICGCGRSGTHYMSTLLNQRGKICGHEEIFSLYRRSNLFGYTFESSWYAAPIIPSLPKRVRILHITREPVKVMRSLYRIGMLADNPLVYMFGEDILPAFSKVVSSPLWAIHRMRLAMRHRWLVRQNIVCFEYTREAQRLEAYWRNWNILVEKNAMRSGKAYMRVRLEDLDDRLPEVSEFLRLGWELTPLSPTNSKLGYTRSNFQIDSLEDETVAVAKRYGYVT